MAMMETAETASKVSLLGARLSGYQKRTDTAIILLLSHGREIWPLWLELGSSDFKAFASK